MASNAPKWSDISASPKFKSAPADEQDQIKRAYFADFVAPTIEDPAQIETGWAEFQQLTAAPSLVSRASAAVRDAVATPVPVAEDASFTDRALASGKQVVSNLVEPFRAPAPLMAGYEGEATATPPVTTVPLEKERVQQLQNLARVRPAAAAKIAERQDWAGYAMRDILAADRKNAERVVSGANLTNPTDQEITARALAPRQVEMTEGGEDNAKIRYNEAGPLGKAAQLFTGGAEQGVLAIQDGVLGTSQALLRLAGADDVADSIQSRQEELKGRQDAAALPASADYAHKMVQGSVASIVQNLPGLLTGAEAPALAAMGLQSFGQEFGTGKAAGLSDGENAVRASLFGVAEMLGEKAGLHSTLAGLKAAARGVPTDKLVTFFTDALLKEIPGEQLTTAMQFAGDKFLPQGLNQKATLEDYMRQAADTLVQTVLQGGMLAGGASAVSAGVRKAEEAAPERSFARALREHVESGQFDPASIDQYARELLNPNQTGVITPEQRTPFLPPRAEAATPAAADTTEDPLGDAPISNPIAGELASLEGVTSETQPATNDQVSGLRSDPSGQPAVPAVQPAEGSAGPAGRAVTLLDQPAESYSPAGLAVLATHPDPAIRDGALAETKRRETELAYQQAEALKTAELDAARQQQDEQQGKTAEQAIAVSSQPGMTSALQAAFAKAGIEVPAALPATPRAGDNRVNDLLEAHYGRNFTTVTPQSLSPLGVGVSGRAELGRREATALEGLAKKLGHQVVFFRGEGAGPSGFIDPSDRSRIYLNVRRGAEGHAVVFGHELLHQIKRADPALYQAFLKAAAPAIGLTPDKLSAFAASYGKPVSADQLVEELHADLFGNRFAEPKFWEDVSRQLGEQNPSMLRKFVAAIQDLINQVRKLAAGQDKFEADLLVKRIEPIQKAAAKVLAEYALKGKSKAAAPVAAAKKTGTTESTERAPLLAPNGKPSKLTPKQYAEVRTPAFKAWFGDWEKYATMEGGVWNDAKKAVSKVVDRETGEPLVVYHGSVDAGFAVFEPGRNPRGTPGAFFTDNRDIALTYSGRRAPEAQIDTDPDSDGGRRDGVYSAYLNLRDPLEEYFEGANWDGDYYDGQVEVINDELGENLYTEDGDRVMDQETAERLLAASEEEGYEIREAYGLGRSTNSVVEEAAESRNDGALMHDVVDNGPRAEVWEPSNVFVIFDANQVKSAVANNGNFSKVLDDIRESPEREALSIQEGRKVEQSYPLSETQWQDTRAIALARLSSKDRKAAVTAEEKYLAGEARANRDAARYKELAAKSLAAMPVPQLSSVPLMTGASNPVIKGTGKNTKTRVIDVARVLRKRILARKADVTTAEGRERVARAMTHEALYSLSLDGHAVGWYDRKVKEAIAVTAVAHPEILHNSEANLSFRLIAAITSNGQAVRDNFILANDVYKIWRAEKQFPTEFEGGGTRAPAMKAAFAKVNAMIGEFGWAKTEAELMALRSVRAIEQEFGLKIGGELKDALVPTAVGMGGPKIGNFFANLSGYFDSPTMDLWFMRTIGRMTGGIIQTKPGLVGHLEKTLALLPEKGEVHGVKVAKIRREVAAYKSLTEAEQLDPELTLKVLKETDRYARAQYAKFAAPDANNKTFTDKSPANENARSLKANLATLVEAPGNGRERAALRDTVTRALTLLAREGIQLNAADLQAVLWYYEKNLYGKLGDISESAKPWDYASAARFGVGRELGLVDVGSSDRAEQVRGGQPAAVAAGVHGGDEAADGPRAIESPTRVNFEVAPDPNDAKLSAAWNALAQEDRYQISTQVAREIVPQALAAFGTSGKLVTQVGSYLDDTNTSFALQLDDASKADPLQKFLGHVLAQDSMMTISETAFPGADPVDAITIDIGDADPKTIYDQLRSIEVDGEKVVGGQSTANGQMAVLNYSSVPSPELARLIDVSLANKYTVSVDAVYAAFPSKEEYGYARSDSQQTAERSPLQRDADRLRREATRAVGAAVQEAGRAPAQEKVTESAVRSPLARAFLAISDAGGHQVKARSAATDLKTVLDEMSVGLTQGVALHHDGGNEIVFGARQASGKGSQDVTIHNAQSKTPYVTIFPNRGTAAGSHMYQMVMSWAHNNGKTLVPDSSLSTINRLRRSEAMISSMLREKTTRHVEPSTYQFVGMLPHHEYRKLVAKPDGSGEMEQPLLGINGADAKLAALKKELWTDAPGDVRLTNMIVAATRLALYRAPELQRYHLTPEGQIYEFENGKWKAEPLNLAQRERLAEKFAVDWDKLSGIPAAVQERPGFRRPASQSGLGGTTVLRALLAKSLLSELEPARLDGAVMGTGAGAGLRRPEFLAGRALWAEAVQGDLAGVGRAFAGTPLLYSPERGPLFYSALSRAVETARAESQPAQQWKLWITANQAKLGIKADEVQWTGIQEWLDLQGKAKVTKAQIAEYLAANGVQVSEVLKEEGIKDFFVEDRWGGILKDGFKTYQEADDWAADHGHDAEDVWIKQNNENSGSTKYGEYGPAGAVEESYRELLLTLPARARSDATDAAMRAADQTRAVLEALPVEAIPSVAKSMARQYDLEIADMENAIHAIRADKGLTGKADFKSSHWDEANILAHVRFDERTDAAGARVVFIREIQSDWGQGIKKHGTQVEADPAEVKRLAELVREKDSDLDNAKSLWQKAAGDKKFWFEKLTRMKADPRTPAEEIKDVELKLAKAALAVIEAHARTQEAGTALQEAMNAQERAAKPRGLPAAPFVTDTKAWLGLGIKRMVRYAAENGFDKVAFITGQQAADMFDLSKRIERVEYAGPQQDGSYHVIAIPLGGGRDLMGGHYSLQGVEDHLGKEIAQKIEAGEGEDHDISDDYRVLRGLDLQVGGEGMKAFYDQIVPQVANDVLKKLGGGKLGPIDFGVGQRERWEDLRNRSSYSANKLTKEELTELRRLEELYNVDEDKQPADMGLQPGFTITEEMRAKVLAGQPLFSPARRAIARLDAAIDGLSNLPDQFEYMRDRYLALGKIAHVDEIVAEIRDTFRNVPQADKQAVYDYLTTRGASATQIGPTELRAAAVRIKQTINLVSDQLVARGLLDPASRAHYRDQYLPRLYLKHLLNEGEWKMIGAGKKPSDMGYLKHRKDIAPEVRELILGEIKDPAFLSANAIGRSMRDIALLDWLARISQNQHWIFPGVMVPFRGQTVSAYWLKAEAERIENQLKHYTPANQARAQQLVATMRQTAQQALATLDVDHTLFKQVPDTNRYGLMRGLYVRKEIYQDIMGLNGVVNADPTWFESFFGIGHLGTRLTQYWKFSKVAANPPGQIRNFISNMVMLQLSGIGLHRMPVRFIQAARDIANDGPYWKVAKKYGVTESTFTAQELYRIKRDLVELESQVSKMNPLTWIKAAGLRLFDGLSNAYQFSEALGKTMKIIDEMKAGKTEAEAAIEAQKWLFDYSLVPQWVRVARNSPVGMPFVTYAVKVLPRMLEVAATAPWRFLPWVGLLYGMQYLVAGMFGVGYDDLEKLKKSLPEWLRDKGHTVFLPFKDADGRVQVADVGYFFPWTQYTTTGKHLVTEPGKALGDVGSMFSAPVIGTAAALIGNYDSFTKKPVYNPADPASYQAAAIANYLYDFAVPPIISSHGVASPMGLVDKQYGGKAVQAATGTTNKFGDPKATAGQAAAAAFGLNFYGLDPEHSRATNLQLLVRQVQDAEGRLKSRLMDRGLTDAARAKVVADYQARMQEIAQDAAKYAEESEVPEKLKAQR